MLAKRLAKLEARQSARADATALWQASLPADLLGRIAQAQAEGTFPQSLASADLEALDAFAVDLAL